MTIRTNDIDVLKRIAKRNLRSNRLKNILTITTITISIALITTMILLSFSTREASRKSVERFYQVFIRQVSEATIESINHADEVKMAGGCYLASYKALGEDSYYVNYYDETLFDYMIGDIMKGSYPSVKDRIVVSQQMLKNLGSNAAIGDSIRIDIGAGEADYVISGIMESNNDATTNQMIFISKELLEKINPDSIRNLDMYLWMDNVFNKSEMEIKKQISKIALENGITEERLSYNTDFFSIFGNDMSMGEILQLIMIALLILAAGAIVVYSIFYVSIHGKIREYGRFRTLGMTTRQIKRIILLEGRYLMIRGISLGIILGIIASYCLCKEGWNLKNTIITIMIATVFGYGVIHLSIRKPALIATKITPVEAIRYSEYQGSMGKRIGKKGAKFNLNHLAFCNLTRNPKKTCLSLLSVILCGTLFWVVASVQKSFTAENMVKQNKFLYGDYKIMFEGNRSNIEQYGANAKSYGLAVSQQANNTLGRSFLDELTNIDGVKDYIVYHSTTVLYAVKGTLAEEEQASIWGYSRKLEDQLSSNIEEGTADYESLLKNKGIIINGKDLMKEILNWDVKIGDIVQILFWREGGDVVTDSYTVMGITEGSDGFPNYIRMPEELLMQATDYNCARCVEIITENGENEALTTALNQVTKKLDLSIESFSDKVNELNESYETPLMVIYILIIFLSLFSIINFINMMITNMVSRKHEIGIFQAVGLTATQLKQSLILEEMWFAVTAIVISAIIGIPFGILGCNIMQLMGVYIVYRFPWFALTIYSVTILIIVFILAMIISWQMNKLTLVERLRSE